MARKKRKGEKEETYEWVPPEFDEKAFLEKDIVSTKTMMISALLAVVFGVLAFGVGSLLGDLSTAALLVIFAGAAGLKYFYRLFRLESVDIDKKLLVGNIAMFVLLALGIWIMLMNEPFTL